MAPLPQSLIIGMRNWQLRADVEDLQNAYRSALKGLVHRQSEIEDMARAALGLGPTDNWPDRNDEDPDDPIAELYEHASELDAQSVRGEHMVRKAFLIALFHAWERHCNARLKRANYATSIVNAMLTGDNRASACEAVEELQLAANCAKHGPGSSGRNLFAKRRDLFPRAATASEASEKTLVVDATTLEYFFAAVLDASR